MTDQERNKQRYRDLIERAVNRRNPDSAWDAVLPNYCAFDPSLPRKPGPEGVAQVFDALRTAIPDMHYIVDEVIAEGNLIAARWRITGTVEGSLYGIRGKGRRVEIRGMSFDRFEDGGMIEGWVQWDLYGLLTQLGALCPVLAIDAKPA
jgi:predicted ester cyclase